MIRIIDGNNWVHVKLATETVNGSIVRDLFFDTLESSDQTIWVFDGANGNARRKAFYPQYKEKRKPTAEAFYVSLELLKKVLLHSNTVICEVPGYEGDDVIATLATDLAQTEDVLIMSTDGDLFALTANPRIKSIRDRVPGVDRPDDVHLYKTLVGDQSDNISGIPNFGQKRFDACNKSVFLKYFEKPFPLTKPKEVASLFNVPIGNAEWMVGHRTDLEALWLVTSLFRVPDVHKYMVPAQLNVQAAEAILGRFML
ncbi:MAG: hypothetical protein GC184_06170 [Rhizobiales bacterium]|nr:hypothetical protein [Hyphomicrobiales bacterium]